MLYFVDEKIEKHLEDIKASIYRETYPIASFKFAEGDFDGAQLPDFDDGDWQTFNVMDYWGGYDVIAWFRAEVPIPDAVKDKRLVLRFLVGPRDGGESTAETLLYVNGDPLQAIDVWHEEAWLPPEYLQQGSIHIALRAWSGVLGVPDRRRFKVAELNVVEKDTEDFYHMAYTLLQAYRELDENDWRRAAIISGLNEAFKLVNFTRPKSDEYYQSVSAALAYLRQHLDDLRGREREKPVITAVGHSHIDMAWLWRLRATRDKASRTFSTMLHLMRQYPEFQFMHSSPQLYEYLAEDHPEIFEQVKARIASGEWEITGGMWIESDINVPSGESLIRQFLLGIRYTRDTFGKETNLLWLPDVFGYSWALPQIIKGCGVDYFMTTKISWSQFNRFPHDTFKWRGIDGSEVLTHFITTPEHEGLWFYTYNGQLRPQDLKGIWDAYRQKEVNDELLLAYGWGDGGGGPTKEMLEQRRVMEDVPGFPRAQTGKAEPFFQRLDERMQDKQLPVWDGELYLEYHRGTYTSQAANKRANRQSEVLYHDAEWLSVLADDLLDADEYPRETLIDGWKLILLNQFHDILPGSSIREVYEDSLADYEQVRAIGEDVLNAAQSRLLANIRTQSAAVTVFNPLSWVRDDLLTLDLPDGKTLQMVDGTAAPVQISADGEALVQVRDVPSLGYRTFPLVDAPPSDNRLQIAPDRLENDYYLIELNQHGQISRLFDKENNREVLADGAAGNRFIAFEDKPMRFDAWDIDLYYQEKPYDVGNLIEATVEETGPVRGTVRLVWRFYDSTITQRMSIYAHSRRIDFRTHVDWQEQQVLLKVAFPVNIRTTRATYDIQFGNIERPTHHNTSWDYAKFEVPAHKWADLSETNYGVSLLNDCKYGYDIKDNVMRLTLIKSAIRPDAQADKGEHVFTYSLLPHAGGWRAAQVPREGYALNLPLRGGAVPANGDGTLSPAHSFAEVDAESVVIETVKRAEDERAWVVRVYENQGNRLQGVKLRFAKALSQAAHTNLIEEHAQPHAFDGDTLAFDIVPYEIKTFIVRS